MPKPVSDISFEAWIEDVFKSLAGLPKGTVVSTWNANLKKYFIIKVDAETQYSSPKEFDAYLFTESADTLRDIKGITVAINIKDLTEHPIETLKALGKKTIDDISNMDEAGADRMANTVEALVAGETSRKGKRDLTTPDNMTLYVLKKMGLDMTDSSGIIENVPGVGLRSRIQLISSDPRNGPTAAADEDRKIAEEGGNKYSKYKSYAGLAAALSGISGYVESGAPREFYYKNALTEFQRSTVREIGLDLEKILPTERVITTGPFLQGPVPMPASRLTTSTLLSELRSTIPVGSSGTLENFEDMLADPVRMNNALDLGSVGLDFATLSPDSQEILRGWVRSEVFTNTGVNEVGELTGPYRAAFTLDELSKGHSAGALYTNKYTYLDGVLQNEAYKHQILNEFRIRQRLPALRAEVTARVSGIELDKELDALNLAYRTPATRLGGLDEFVTNGHITAVQRDVIANRVRQAGDNARERLDSAARAMQIGTQLNFYGATEDLLNAIEEGNFLKTAFVSSRFFGLLPLAPGEMDSLKHVTALVDKTMKPIENVVKPIKSNISQAVGLTYDPKLKYKGLLTVEGKVSIGWDIEQIIAGKKVVKSHQLFVNAAEGKGLFGQFSATDIASKLFGQGQSSTLLVDIPGIAGPGGLPGFTTLNELFSPRASGAGLNIEVMMGRLYSASIDWVNSHAAGTPIVPNAYHQLATALGIITNDPIRTNENIHSLKDNIYNMSRHGRQLMAKVDAEGLPANMKWDFLKSIITENKAKQFTNGMMGILEAYSRYTNAFNTFLYKQIIWEQYTGSNLFLRGLVNTSKPIRAVLRGLGFSDGMTLAQRVSRFNIIQAAQGFGEKLLNASLGTASGGTANVFASQALRNIIVALSKSKFLASVIRSAALLAANASGIATAGLSYLLMAIGELGWAVGRNVLTFRFDRIGADVKVLVTKKLNTVKKIVWSISCLVLSCISLPLIIIFFIVATILAPIEGMGGAGSYNEIFASKMVKVEKSGVVDIPNKKITYTLKLTNIAKDANGNGVDIKITELRDQVSYTDSCTNGGNVNIFSTPNTQWGNARVNGNPKIPDINDIPNGGNISAGSSLTITYEIIDIKSTDDGTYTNSVEAIVEGEDSTKSGFATESNNIGGGGCNECPSGWPNSTGSISQGRGGSYSHQTAEAIDVVGDSSIRATHNGRIAIAQDETADCQQAKIERDVACSGSGTDANLCNLLKNSYFNSACAYGNYVKIEGSTGYISLYAHLQSIEDSIKAPGTSIQKGTAIGIMGSTGNSTASHLHYEFPPLNKFCNGYLVKMENVDGDSFIPITTDYCGGDDQPPCSTDW